MNDITITEAEETEQIMGELSTLKKQNAELSQAGFELITAQARLQSLLHNASDGIITFAADGTIETFNLAAQKIFGYTESEVINRKIPDLIPCPDWIEDNVGTYINYFVSSRASTEIPLTGKHKLGFDILLHVSTGKATNENTIVFDDFNNEDPFADDITQGEYEPNEDSGIIVCFLRDITQDKKLEKELADHKYALDLAAGVIMRDKDFRIIDINNNFCKTLGRNRSEFIGEKFTQSNLCDSSKNERELNQRTVFLSNGNTWVGESCFLNKKNEPTWFTESTTPFLDEHKIPYQYLSILINITDRKKSEEQLKQHRDHLQDLVDEQVSDLRQARDAAEIANIAKSEFLANMSHELRTPLHAIVSFTNLCLKQLKTVPLTDYRTKKLHKFLTSIEISSQRLLSLLNNLLDLSKLESGKAELNIKNNDLFLLSQQIHTEYSAKIQEKRINFILKKPTIPLLIACDKTKILQVLSNLIANAIKFSPKHKTILVSFESTEINLGKRSTDIEKTSGILLSIADQGIGIPDKELAIVFDKFIQSSKTKSGAGGTGLGLSICQEIILAHKGKIWVEHNPEGGAIFKLFLPG